MTSYQNLSSRFLQLSHLKDAMAILQWDEAVMMPAGSSESRNQSLAEISGLIQKLATSKEVGDWITELGSPKVELNTWEKANLREIKREYVSQTSMSPELNQKLLLARMNCEQKWRSLRGQNDWASFKPYLQEVLTLTREATQCLSDATGLPLYDAALSEYSGGLTTKVVEALFTEIKGFLPGLIAEVAHRQLSEKVILPEGVFPMSAQKDLARELMSAVGFSFENGRLDESHHPFCGGTSRDVRITTRYNEREFVSALMGVLHETGHAMYEQHLPLKWQGQPVGSAAGMAVHESQSLFMEMQVCRSAEFMEFATPFIRKHFNAYVRNPESLTTENLTRLVTRVKPGYIRVDADEVTYPAHVILRFELERALLEGSLSLDDLPAAWNEKMSSYLGLNTEGNFKDGCMQDVHWPAGLFGYFPAYTFGAVIAAHLFKAIKSKTPNVGASVQAGDFKPMQTWLDEKIWSQGSRLTTLNLVEEAAGPLTAQAFRDHLQTRYLGS